MEKLVRHDKVAVLISPGFGAGWSTWNSEFAEILCMDRDIVQAVLDGDKEKAAAIAQEKCDGDLYTGGAKDLDVAWLPIGSQFEVEEYDGAESLHVIGTRRYLTA